MTYGLLIEQYISTINSAYIPDILLTRVDLADHLLAALKAAVRDFGSVRDKLGDPEVVALVVERVEIMERRIQEMEREFARLEKRRNRR